MPFSQLSVLVRAAVTIDLSIGAIMVISFVALNVGLVVGICIVFARASMVRKIEDKLRMKLHFKDLPEEHMNTVSMPRV